MAADKIQATVKRLDTYYNLRDKKLYCCQLAELEVDLARYYAILGKSFMSEIELLSHYSRLWELS